MEDGGEIERRFGPELRRFCRRMVFNEALAEDIVQDVIAVSCEKADDPRSVLPPNEPHRMRGWLYRVARNRCIDELRKMRPEVRLSAIQSSRVALGDRMPIDPLTTPAGKAVKAERVEAAQAALDGLDDDLRSVLIMRVYQDLSREEIAQVVGLSVAGVKARLAKATRMLRESLHRLDESSS